MHALRDRLPVPVAAHLAAQLPELLRGVFYDGWNPSHMPIEFDSAKYVWRFVRDATIHDTEVPRTARLVARVARRRLSGGALDEALDTLPTSGSFRPPGHRGPVREERASAFTSTLLLLLGPVCRRVGQLSGPSALSAPRVPLQHGNLKEGAGMKLVTAVVRPDKLDDVVRAVCAAGARG